MSERQGGLRKRTKPFTQTPNETVDDWTLSFRELGLLIRLLRMPEGFVIRSEQLATEGRGKTKAGRKPNREGREAVRTALRNLSLAGYYRLERCRKLDGTFMMRTSITEDADEQWAEQAAVFKGKAVPLYQQGDGTYLVKYPNGVMLPDGFPPPAVIDDETDTTDDEAEENETPETGFRAPGIRPPGKAAPGKAAPGSCAPLSKTVREDGYQDSVPPPSVRLDDEIGGDSSVDGQMTIDGKTEAPAGEREPTLNDVAMGLARGWSGRRTADQNPIVMLGKNSDPVMALRKLILPYLESGYSEDEIKHALAWTDTGVPNAALLDSGLSAVRRGWRTPRGWKSGDGRGAGRPAGRQRQGTGAMAQTNLHVDDVTPEQRQRDNPFAGASRQSDYATTDDAAPRGAVA